MITIEPAPCPRTFGTVNSAVLSCKDSSVTWHRNRQCRRSSYHPDHAHTYVPRMSGAGSRITCSISRRSCWRVQVHETTPTHLFFRMMFGMNDDGGTPYQLELCAWPESSVIEHSRVAHYTSPNCTAQRLLLTRDAHVSLSLEYTNLKKQQSQSPQQTLALVFAPQRQTRCKARHDIPNGNAPIVLDSPFTW